MRIKTVVVLALFCVLSSTQVFSANEKLVKAYFKRIDALMAQKKYEISREMTIRLESLLKEGDKKTTNLNEAKLTAKHMATLLNTRAEAEAKMGEFMKAANTQRESHSFVASAKNIDKVLGYTTKDRQQAEYFAAKSEFLTNSYVSKKEVLALTAEKAQMVEKFLTKSEIKKEELEALQTSLKGLDKKIQEKNTEIQSLQDKFQPIFAEFETKEIPFSKDQDEAIIKSDKELADIIEASTIADASAQTGLLEIVEKFKWGWDGLEGQMTTLQGIQDKLMKLQVEMLALLEKKTLTAAEKKVLLDLKMQSDKLMSEHALLMADIEKGFMDSKVFSKLTPEQQAKYFEIFKTMHEAGKVIIATNTKIDAFIKTLVTLYGDMNGDGKVDRKDCVSIAKIIMRRPVRKPTSAQLRVGDVNGDGKLTWADYTLMRQVANGNRKLFPVDPEHLAGDMNGDGKLSWSDINVLIRTIFAPKSTDNAWKGIADVNGDGKLNMADLSKFVEEIRKEAAKKMEAQEAAADEARSGTQGSGDARGEVRIENNDSTNKANPAAGIDSSY